MDVNAIKDVLEIQFITKAVNSDNVFPFYIKQNEDSVNIFRNGHLEKFLEPHLVAPKVKEIFV